MAAIYIISAMERIRSVKGYTILGAEYDLAPLPSDAAMSFHMRLAFTHVTIYHTCGNSCVGCTCRPIRRELISPSLFQYMHVIAHDCLINLKRTASGLHHSASWFLSSHTRGQLFVYNLHRKQAFSPQESISTLGIPSQSPNGNTGGDIFKSHFGCQMLNA